MKKTIKDVALLAGVSTATVSRVLAPEKTGPVSEETRKKVKDAAENLGFQMNYMARSLKRRSTMTIAVLFPELSNDYFMDVAEGIEQELHTEGYSMLLSSSLNSVEEEKRRINLLSNRMVDGMLIIPTSSQGRHFQVFSDRGMPIVFVDRIVEGTELDAVTSDNEGGTFRLTQALLEDGYKQIAFVGGDITLSSARERLSGYARALAEAGIKPEPSWICLGGMRMEDGYKHMERFLRRQNPVEAMVAVNLLVHLGMERCILDMNGFTGSFNAENIFEKYTAEAALLKPSVVIAGFDESRYTPFLPACRYIASQDAVGIGRTAGKRIIEKIKDKKTDNNSGGGRIIRLPVSISRPKGSAPSGGRREIFCDRLTVC